MWQILVRAAIVISTIVLGTMCGYRTEMQEPSNPSNVGSNLDQADEKEAQLRALITEISHKMQLDRLSDTLEDRNRFEVRLWTNVGNFFEKVLVVTSKRNRSTAAFFEIQRNEGPTEVQRKTLTVPKSGWSSFFSVVKRTGVEVPLKLRSETLVRLSRDEAIIFLEVIDGGKYDFVYYSQLTSSVDGKKLMEFCNYAVYEFDANLDCLGKLSIP